MSNVSASMIDIYFKSSYQVVTAAKEMASQI
jgi:hypothetical protein